EEQGRRAATFNGEDFGKTADEPPGEKKSHVDPRPGSHRHLPLPHPRRGPARARLRVEAHRPALEGQRRHRQRRRDHLDDQHVALLAVRVDAPVAPPDQAGVRGVELSWKAKGRFNGREGGYSSRRERERNMDGMIEGETQCGATGGVRNTPRYCHFASDVIGDGTEAVVGQFEAAQPGVDSSGA
ncbi:hypothetical protein THAOC_26117, partial [Thalassiosira oceanica]